MRRLALLFLFSPISLAAEFSVEAAADVAWVQTSNDAPWMQSWIREGTGITRYDPHSDGLVLSQAMLEAQIDFDNPWQLQATAYYYPDGQKHLGFTEAALTFQPLTSGVKHKVRVGAFYPNFGFENPKPGWQSPYTYTFSAINSWIAEEVRAIGGEWQITVPGKLYHSNHTLSFVSSVFGANDGAGTLLSWRGWALHNRQTLLGERVAFADYPGITGPIELQPNWVEPFIETDNRVGYYLGGHWRHRRNTEVRLYRYDNRADPFAVNDEGQYAWHTKFWTVSAKHLLNRQWRILAQWMDGSTVMGDSKGVNVDFDAWYVLTSYKHHQHRFSLRYDDFKTVDTDQNPVDINDSHGKAWTFAWRYQASQHIEVALEYLYASSWNANRMSTAQLGHQGFDWPQQGSRNQWQLVLSGIY
ncbi:hypothetical protein [Ferrimonas marina]|uniref:Phosphate-selective porin O and P n=1 Tax=Ferrimonas marina TaxID=299255 RepID=A0A1M5S169_9GAMM|nr:hypothetical protein [Ferrimonas marina]SHH32204.1 hypothetical protein SAMN02745129_1832 [Ferrimonas marina]